MSGRPCSQFSSFGAIAITIATSGLITGAFAGAIFGGIGYAYKTTTLARAASSLDAAENDLAHSMGVLRAVPELSQAPFASSNIAKVVATAAANYNSAYLSFIMAKSMYYVYNGVAEIAYFVGENWLADWLGGYFRA